MQDLESLFNESEKLLSGIFNKNMPQKEMIICMRNIFSKTVLNNYCYTGNLNEDYIKILGSKTGFIKFSMDSLMKNRISHPDLKLNDYKKIKNILCNYDEAVFDKKGNLRFFKDIENKLYEIVVKTTKNGKENYLTTFHRCDKSKLKNLKR